MTADPKKKAKELIEKFLSQQSYTEEMYDAKQCALICVNQILEDQDIIMQWCEIKDFGIGVRKNKDFWKEVKQELQNK